MNHVSTYHNGHFLILFRHRVSNDSQCVRLATYHQDDIQFDPAFLVLALAPIGGLHQPLNGFAAVVGYMDLHSHVLQLFRENALVYLQKRDPPLAMPMGTMMRFLTKLSSTINTFLMTSCEVVGGLTAWPPDANLPDEVLCCAGFATMPNADAEALSSALGAGVLRAET